MECHPIQTLIVSYFILKKRKFIYLFINLFIRSINLLLL